MVKIFENARAELQDWIEKEVAVEYYVDGALPTPKNGIGILKRRGERQIELIDRAGEEVLVIMTNQREIVKYCPPSADGFRVTVRSPRDDIYINLKPQQR